MRWSASFITTLALWALSPLARLFDRRSSEATRAYMEVAAKRIRGEE